jgi:HD-like signal output (HDOD) protein
VKLANSGFFGIREPVLTVERAVSFVGMEAISMLVLGQELFDANSAVTIPGFDLERLGKHSFETAAWARAVALHEGLSVAVADSAFLAGVVHDVGRLVFATRTAPTSASQRTEWLAKTFTQMQTHHAAVGAYLLGLWGFANPIIEAIAWHHTPGRCGEIKLGFCGLLHIADQLAHEHDRDAPAPSASTLEPGYLESLGLADRWSAWEATRPEQELACANLA